MTIKDGFKDEVGKHWIWIITTVFFIGGAWVTLAYQGSTLTKNTIDVAAITERMVKVEKTDIELHAADMMVMARLDTIAVDIKDLKNTVEKNDVKLNERMTKMADRTQTQFEEIKKILYKPAIGGNTQLHEGSLADTAISILNR